MHVDTGEIFEVTGKEHLKQLQTQYNLQTAHRPVRVPAGAEDKIMGKNSEISWTDHTWNPWQGCRKVSDGCKNCYMFRNKKRWGQDGSKIHMSSWSTIKKPLSWKEPAKVFTCSWSDFFLPEADFWRESAWDIIRKTPHLTYQILTKRPERIRECLPPDWPLKNVWLGVTAENQEQADIRIPIMLEIQAIVHFVSIEPMLGPVKMAPEWMRCQTQGQYMNIIECGHGLVNWVICGGESGPGFREMKKEWAWDLLQQTEIPQVPFFMKQMSGINPKNISIPDVLKVKEFPVTPDLARAI